jgi:hypothetical protein
MNRKYFEGVPMRFKDNGSLVQGIRGVDLKHTDQKYFTQIYDNRPKVNSNSEFKDSYQEWEKILPRERLNKEVR